MVWFPHEGLRAGVREAGYFDSKVLSNKKKSYNPVLNPGGFPGRF